MSYLYIADLHLSHKNVITHDARPFASVEDMNEALTANWNSAVSDTDTVFILGDVIWDKKQKWHTYLTRLQGHKVLVFGNHDHRHLPPETAALFDETCDYKELTDSAHRVILSHYPIPFHNNDYDPDTWMLYGHVHVTPEYDILTDLRRRIKTAASSDPHAPRGNFINVGAMMPWMDYTPRTLDEIIEAESHYPYGIITP